MEKAIEKAKQIIDYYFKNKMRNPGFGEYTQFYLGTNEKINLYLKDDDIIPNGKALSILSSGDHIFNLIYKGIIDIDGFDLNFLTEYFALGLKRALAAKSSFKEYEESLNVLNLYYSSNEDVLTILSETTPYIENEHRKFWLEIINYMHHKLRTEGNLETNVFHSLGIQVNDLFPEQKADDYNGYMANELEFEKFKSKLLRSNITFKQANAINLWESFNNNTYNYVFLSNILTYLCNKNLIFQTKEGLMQYINSLAKLINQNGIIYLYYAFWYNESNLDNNLRELINENEFYDCNCAIMYLKRVNNGEIKWKEQ